MNFHANIYTVKTTYATSCIKYLPICNISFRHQIGMIECKKYIKTIFLAEDTCHVIDTRTYLINNGVNILK